MCSALCKLIGCLLTWAAFCATLLLIVPFGLLLAPSIEDRAFLYLQESAHGTKYAVGMKALEIRHIAYCKGDTSGCAQDELSQDLSLAYGWKSGIGKITGPASLALTHHEVAVYFSHAACRERSYDPDGSRVADLVLAGVNSTRLSTESSAILSSFDVANSGYRARRELYARAFPTLSKTAFEPQAISRPPGVRASDAAILGNTWLPVALRFSSLRPAVFNTVAATLFQTMFNVDLTRDELDLLLQYEAETSHGLPLTSRAGERLREIRNFLLPKLAASDNSKRFNDSAKDKRLDPLDSLDEVMWATLYAGYGGSAYLAFEALKLILQAPSTRLELFRSDTRAFMMEIARLYPPMGGAVPIAVRSLVLHKLHNGEEMALQPGDMALSLIGAANKDPAVFEDPQIFKPGRANAERLLSWNNEWADFKECPTVAGCPKAPRGNPFMFLSMRVATKVVEYFADGIASALVADNKDQKDKKDL